MTLLLSEGGVLLSLGSLSWLFCGLFSFIRVALDFGLALALVVSLLWPFVCVPPSHTCLSEFRSSLSHSWSTSTSPASSS